MKVYEFELKTGEIEVTAYEVKECEKTYVVLAQQESKRNYIRYNYLTRIPKNLLDNELGYSLNEHFYLSLENDIEKAKNAFLKYIEERKLPSIEENIESLTKKKEIFLEKVEMLKTGKGLEGKVNE